MNNIPQMMASGLVALTFAFQPFTAAQAQAEEQYMDNRSTPQKLIESFYNAINKKQYARAYRYYAANGSTPKDFQTWADGYANTKHVSVKFGPTEPDPGAGQIYWALPVALSVLSTDGSEKVFTGCYEIHMTNPGIVTDPPHHPMGIENGHFKKSNASFVQAGAELGPIDQC